MNPPSQLPAPLPKRWTTTEITTRDPRRPEPLGYSRSCDHPSTCQPAPLGQVVDLSDPSFVYCSEVRNRTGERHYRVLPDGPYLAVSEGGLAALGRASWRIRDAVGTAAILGHCSRLPVRTLRDNSNHLESRRSESRAAPSNRGFCRRSAVASAVRPITPPGNYTPATPAAESPAD